MVVYRKKISHLKRPPDSEPLRGRAVDSCPLSPLIRHRLPVLDKQLPVLHFLLFESKDFTARRFSICRFQTRYLRFTGMDVSKKRLATCICRSSIMIHCNKM